MKNEGQMDPHQVHTTALFYDVVIIWPLNFEF